MAELREYEELAELAERMARARGLLDSDVRASSSIFLIQHHNLTIQNGALSLEAAQDLLKKRIKLLELLPLARHQPGLVAVDIQDPAKAVVLQLVDPVGTADRLL